MGVRRGAVGVGRACGGVLWGRGWGGAAVEVGRGCGGGGQEVQPALGSHFISVSVSPSVKGAGDGTQVQGCAGALRATTAGELAAVSY